MKNANRGRWNVVLALGALVLAAAAAQAAENSYLPAAGGAWSSSGNWSLGHCPISNENVRVWVSGAANKAVNYDYSNGAAFSSVNIDGGNGYYGAIWQLQGVMTTYNMYLGYSGLAYHWMEGPAYLWVNDNLYIGYQNSGGGAGSFYLSTLFNDSAGLHVGDLCYVGYMAPGTFDHTGGIAEIYRLYVGQNGAGTYYLRSGRLEVANQIVIGNGADGTIEQTGGTFEQTGTNGILLGLNTGGAGTYAMKGGTLDIDHISIAWNSDGYFTQSGGTVTTTGSIHIGCQGTHPMQAWYKLNQDNGPAVLNVGGNLNVGVQTYGKYEQTAGTCNVAGNLEIWRGTTSGTSRVYLGLDAGLLDVDGEVINHSGYYDQDGGTLNTSHFTNDSTQGVYIDNNADFRATNLTHNAGTFWMYRNAKLRGTLAIPPSTFWACNFTNNATFQMGSAAADGGTFGGHLANYGTFNYNQGNFGNSTLTNYGTVNLNRDFACKRLMNAATLALPDDRFVDTAGSNYAIPFENSGTFKMSPRARVAVGTRKFVNAGQMYAGAPGTDAARVEGLLENNGFLQPSLDTLASGALQVTGDFTAGSTSELRVRLRGTATSSYDRLNVTGLATLAGTLSVRLASGYVPAIGSSFSILTCGSRSGEFNTLSLPALPSGRHWQVQYGSAAVVVRVVAGPAPCAGDANCDGVVSWRDIDYFIAGLNDNTAAWQALFPAPGPTCAFSNLDCQVPPDGHVTWRDIDPFIARLNTTCP